MKRRCPPGSARIAVAYVRVSTREQDNGLEVQRTAIDAWAAREGVHVAAWCVDSGVSGGSALGERPALVDALSALRATGAGILVAQKRDRIARDVEVALAVESAVKRLGARVVSVEGVGNGDSPADRLVRVILDAAAEHERALIGLRTRAALAAKRARGEVTGAPRYGFRKEGKAAVVDAREQAILVAAQQLRATGISLRKVGVALVSSGMLSRTGKPFTVAALHAMLSTSRAA